MMDTMSHTFEHPSLTLHVTEQQRDRAEQWLQEAYADGRVSESEFDARIGQVISAVTRRDLNSAFYGLVQVPMHSQALGKHPVYHPAIRPETRQQAGRGVAGFAHFSGFFFWLFGPGLVFVSSSPGSYSRREAAKAFNFQLVSTIAVVLMIILGAVTGVDVFFFLAWMMSLAWVVMTIVGGAKALQGENWRNPVKNVIKFEALSEK